MGSRPILLVEDDDADVLAVRRALRDLELEHRLRVAHNGDEALDVLRGSEDEQPCVILLDLDMPRNSGLKFLKTICEGGCPPEVPFVFLTTSGHDGDAFDGLGLNIAATLAKPVDYRKLVEVIHAIDLFSELNELPS